MHVSSSASHLVHHLGPDVRLGNKGYMVLPHRIGRFVGVQPRDDQRQSVVRAQVDAGNLVHMRTILVLRRILRCGARARGASPVTASHNLTGVV